MQELNRKDGSESLSSGQWSEEQRAAVLAETIRILDSPPFKSSKRCVTLFRVLVDHALSGDCLSLKERTLGIEVFERPANYDTGTDPIVRRTANEIRKRLAQCYLNLSHPPAVQIHLEPGSYLPEFEFLAPEQTPQVTPALAHPQPQSSFTRLAGGIPRRRLLGALAALCAIVVLSVLGVYLRRTHSAGYQLWKPFITSNQHLMICVSDMPIQANGLPVQLPEFATKPSGTAPEKIGTGKLDRYGDSRFTDVNIAHILASRLASDFKLMTTLRPASELNFTDFHRQPLLLIGSYNNPWSQPLMEGLRFQPQYDMATHERWISDTQAPDRRNWIITQTPTNTYAYDYAILSRFLNPQTKQWVMALSGLSYQGTQAAGELIADPKLMSLIPANLRTAGNFQLILKVDIVHGAIGVPQIVASHTW